ncbi:MAG: hypothetical protein NC432_09595 [Roseburia sp.]|nr:hypothetical protein [Roseburia sp.]MCM1098230.1 hypothetical protein [Ruminococcus flavefaciens]
MKKIVKTLLAVTGSLSAGLGAYALWDSYVQKKEQHKKAVEAEKRAAFIARRKARARAKAAARAEAVLGTEEKAETE